MKQWLIACLIAVSFTVSGCGPKPTDPVPDPTATPVPPIVVATATATATAGGGTFPTPLPTATPVPTVVPTPVPTPGGTAFTVRYEVVATGTTQVNLTYLDDYNSYPIVLASGTWTQTVTMHSGFETMLIVAHFGMTAGATTTATIYVDGTAVATDSRTGITSGPAYTISYWLP
jgi:hypothetical protein